MMDEPTSALSEREVAQLFAAIARLTANGVAVIYITHRMDEVFRIGQRVTVCATAARGDPGHRGRHRVRAGPPDGQPGRERPLPAPDAHPRRRTLRVDGLAAARSATCRSCCIAARFSALPGGRRRTDAPGPRDCGRRSAGSRADRDSRDDSADRVTGGRGAARIGFLPEDRKQQGLVLGLTVERNVSLSHLAALARFGVVARAERDARRRRRS